jgi:hypothetical protein
MRGVLSSRGQVFLLPFFFLNQVGFKKIQADLSRSAAFNRLYPLDVLKRFFFSELEDAIVNRMKASNPTVANPVILNNEFCIVNLDGASFWSDAHIQGSYYIFAGRTAKADRSLRQGIETKIKNLDWLKGGADQVVIDNSIATYSEFLNRIPDNPDWHSLKMDTLDIGLKVPFRR